MASFRYELWIRLVTAERSGATNGPTQATHAAHATRKAITGSACVTCDTKLAKPRIRIGLPRI
jgi:hypothetical protein